MPLLYRSSLWDAEDVRFIPNTYCSVNDTIQIVGCQKNALALFRVVTATLHLSTGRVDFVTELPAINKTSHEKNWCMVQEGASKWFVHTWAPYRVALSEGSRVVLVEESKKRDLTVSAPLFFPPPSVLSLMPSCKETPCTNPRTVWFSKGLRLSEQLGTLVQPFLRNSTAPHPFCWKGKPSFLCVTHVCCVNPALSGVRMYLHFFVLLDEGFTPQWLSAPWYLRDATVEFVSSLWRDGDDADEAKQVAQAPLFLGAGHMDAEALVLTIPPEAVADALEDGVGWM